MSSRDSYCMLFFSLVALAIGGAAFERVLRLLPLNAEAQRITKSLIQSRS